MRNKNLLLITLWLTCVCLSIPFRFTIPVGEQAACLSCLAIALPLIAYFFPARLSLFLFGGAWLLVHLVRPIPLTAGIPTLLATISWQISGQKGRAFRLFHIGLPLAAIFFFILSPNGGAAWPYALYWMIPIACTFVPTTLFTRALQSTFVQHAAGSVIWAYLIPLPSAHWLGLIPVVAVERLLSTTLSVAMIAVLAFVVQMVSREEAAAVR